MTLRLLCPLARGAVGHVAERAGDLALQTWQHRGLGPPICETTLDDKEETQERLPESDEQFKN